MEKIIDKITKQDFKKLETAHYKKLSAKKYDTWNFGSSSGDNWIASAARLGSSERLVSTINEDTKEITHDWQN